MRPIHRLEDLLVAAFEATEMVCSGKLSHQEAVDGVYGMALGTGLTIRYGEDAVQACISAAFGSVRLEPGATVAPLDDNDGLDRKTLEIDERPKWAGRVIAASDLRTMTFQSVRFTVPGLIPDGLTILASKPKAGKSWLVLDVCLGVTMGRDVLGSLKPFEGRALYLALEDSQRRLQQRIDKLLSAFTDEWPSRLAITTDWPRLNNGGLEDLAAWCNRHPDVRLVVIDTLEKVRPPDNGKGRIYALDYEVVAGLHQLAHARNISIIAVHHLRKADADDPFDTVSGSLGLTGAADTILLLQRQAGAFTLRARGRDIEDSETAIQFDKATCRWTILGAAAEVHRSVERGRVLRALREAGEPMKASEILAAAELKGRNATDILLSRMVRDGEIVRTERGQYALSKDNTGQIGQKERSTH